MTVTNLEALRDAMREIDAGRAQPEDYGLPVAHGDLDWTSLPTFGGVEPADTSGIWSWDETRILWGACADELEIVDRADLSVEG